MICHSWFDRWLNGILFWRIQHFGPCGLGPWKANPRLPWYRFPDSNKPALMQPNSTLLPIHFRAQPEPIPKNYVQMLELSTCPDFEGTHMGCAPRPKELAPPFACCWTCRSKSTINADTEPKCSIHPMATLDFSNHDYQLGGSPLKIITIYLFIYIYIYYIYIYNFGNPTSNIYWGFTYPGSNLCLRPWDSK